MVTPQFEYYELDGYKMAEKLTEIAKGHLIPFCYCYAQDVGNKTRNENNVVAASGVVIHCLIGKMPIPRVPGQQTSLHLPPPFGLK